LAIGNISQTKKPPKSVLQWLATGIMEAVGIEPTSEDKVTGISTGLACLLNLVLFSSNKQDLNETSRKDLTTPPSARKRGQPVFYDALSQPGRQGR